MRVREKQESKRGRESGEGGSVFVCEREGSVGRRE